MKKRTIITISLFLLLIGILLPVVIMSFGAKYRGKSITDGTNPQRIVCLNPAAAETIFALGYSDRLMGVSNYCDWPPQAANISRVGGTVNPNFERIRLLNPDLVIIQGENEKLLSFCRQRNFAVLRLDMRGISGVLADIKTLGNRLGCIAKAEQLCSNIQSRLEQVKKSVAGRRRPKVFISFFRTTGSLSGLSTAGANTHLDEIVKIAGGENIFGDVNIPYPKISKETLLKRQPEIIIEPQSAATFSSARREQCISVWQNMPNIPAVRNKRIYFPDADVILRPGPRLAEAAAELAKIIHGVPDK